MFISEPTIAVDTNVPAVIRQQVTFTMELKRFPESIPLPMCRIYSGDGKQSELVRENFFKFETSFYFPGRYRYRSDCRLREKLFKASGELYVEANLQRPSLGLWFAKADQSYLEEVDLAFTHTYTYPIYYHLTIGTVSFTHQLNSFNRDKFTDKTSTVQRFLLSQTQQQDLGPGKHHFTLVLENNVSSLVLSDDFTLVEPVSNIAITTKNLVGIHPYPFFINVTVGKGAPVYVTINVQKGQANQSIAEMTISCENRCQLLRPSTTLPGPGTDYNIKVTARNEVSAASNSFQSFSAMPLIYDVFVTSLEPMIRGVDSKVLFFLRGDLGSYTMTIHVNHQKRGDAHFQIISTTQTYTVGATFPMNPLSYTMVPVSIMYQASGDTTIHVTLANALKTMYFERKVQVLYESACDITVRIRDGNSKQWPDNPLVVDSFLHLSGNGRSMCDVNAMLAYKWEIFKVDSREDAPGLPLDLKQDFTDPDLVINTSSFSPGLYVTKLAVTVFDQRHWQAIGYEQDFALIQVERQKPYVTIEGGLRRQVGKLHRNVFAF